MFTIPILFLPISCPSYGFHFSPPYIHMHIHTCINTYKYVERLHEGRPIWGGGTIWKAIYEKKDYVNDYMKEGLCEGRTIWRTI
jgi:hypothetical protein